MESLIIVVTVAASFVAFIIYAFGDLQYASYLKRKHTMFPLSTFRCFCKKEIDIQFKPFLSSVGPIRVLWHMSKCLLWIMNKDSRLTLYYQVNRIKDLEKKVSASMLDYYIKHSKEDREDKGYGR